MGSKELSAFSHEPSASLALPIVTYLPCHPEQSEGTVNYTKEKIETPFALTAFVKARRTDASFLGRTGQRHFAL